MNRRMLLYAVYIIGELLILVAIGYFAVKP